jgi:uncharacterized membrane protein YhaH (DUF805 family)
MEWMLMPYRKLYALIAGRSSRKEFWMFVLLNVIVFIAFILLIAMLAGTASLSMTDPTSLQSAMLGAGFGFMAVLILPMYLWLILTGIAGHAVAIRRFHDLNLSGWLYLAFLIAWIVLFIATQSMAVYWIVLLAFLGLMAVPGTKGPNKYGDDSTNPTSAAVFA